MPCWQILFRSQYFFKMRGLRLGRKKLLGLLTTLAALLVASYFQRLQVLFNFQDSFRKSREAANLAVRVVVPISMKPTISLLNYKNSVVALAAKELFYNEFPVSDELCSVPRTKPYLKHSDICSFPVQGNQLDSNSSTIQDILKSYQPYDDMYIFDNCKFHYDFHGITKHFECLPSTTDTYNVEQDNTQYFSSDGPSPGCFKEGTSNATGQGIDAKCICKSKYSGRHCSIPQAVSASNYPMKEYTPFPTLKPRKLVVLFPFNIEFEVLEMRLNTTSDVVDVFIILESNYTAFGEPRPQYLQRLLRRGFLWQHQHKIVRVFLDHYLQEAFNNGWAIDSYLRNYISQSAMPRCIGGLQDDSWIVSFDADEVLHRETMLFLKVHTHIPFPIAAHFGFYKYAFHWKYEPDWHFKGISTYGLLTKCMDNLIHQARGYNAKKFTAKAKVNSSCASLSSLIKEWSMGTRTGLKAGWHCSHCGTPQRAQLKDHSVHVGESQHHSKFYRDTTQAKFVNRFRFGEYYGKRKLTAQCSVNDTAVPYVADLEKYPYMFFNLAARP